jgi:hypothetical protein
MQGKKIDILFTKQKIVGLFNCELQITDYFAY